MPDGPPVIDVERLVNELRGRASELRRRGAYGADVGSGAVPLPAPEARVRFRPELGYSSKPLVGRPLTAVKRVILRLLVHVFDDLAHQADLAIGHAEHRAAQAAEAATAARAWSEAAVAAEVGARERVQRDLSDLLGRLDALTTTLERLQAGPRLARLERAGRAAATPASGPVASPETAPSGASPATTAFDYQSFEARFRGSEESVAVRQAVHLEHLRDRRRVVDLGCGRGELLELLRGEGVSAYGVDSEPDFAALVRERGLEVVQEDAIAHLEGLEAGAVDAVVASHVVEHLPPDRLSRLIGLAAERLEPGGVLLMETPNPESLVAGSINFHRDPTHLRPVHPDTLAFLCESAGFGPVEVLRLAPFAPAEALPASAPGEDPVARHLDRVVEQLNGVLYGSQDYAVVARR